MPDLNDLKQQKDHHASEMLRIREAAQEAGRDMSAEEEQTFDRHMDEYDKLGEQITREEKAKQVEADRHPGGTEPAPHGTPRGDGPDEETALRAWNRFLAYGRDALTQQERDGLVAGKDPEGGYLVAPQQFVNQLIQAVDDAVPLRPLATTMTLTNAESLGVPALDTDLNDAEWTTELGTGSQDDSLRFGKREFRPNPLAKRVKVSRTLLRKSSRDPEDIVRERLAYKFGVTQEKAFMTGDGSKKPLGLFNATSDGISTSRDVDISTDGSNILKGTGGNAADDLIDAKYTLKPQYHSRARWLFHRDAIRDVRKLKDANDQYLWQPGLSGDRPDTIVDIPYTMSEFVPNTFSDNSYIGMLADFSFYWIVDALDMEVQRLVELYAESNQVGFIARAEADGMPVLEEAFVRLQANDVS